MGHDAIVLEQACKTYPGGVLALDRLDLRVARGEWIAVMGPSGSGKSTLFHLVSGLDRPTSGRAEVLGVEPAALGPDACARFRREHIGVVFQEFHLIPYLPAVENVMLAQYYHSVVDRSQALAALERVGLAYRSGHRPAQLSVGERQRVCIARALINEPELVLADEPTANLDEENERIVLGIFERLHAGGTTLVVATHDREVAVRAERTIRLKHGRLASPPPSGRRVPVFEPETSGKEAS